MKNKVNVNIDATKGKGHRREEVLRGASQTYPDLNYCKLAELPGVARDVLKIISSGCFLPGFEIKGQAH